jgi:uncharacterized membrane protein (DUF485 family)
MDSPQENGPLPSTPRLDCARIAGSKQFKHLLAVKRMFIIPALSFFLLSFMSFVMLVGYVPKLASIRVIGTVNLAYLFALFQFVLGWMIAGLYLIASENFDRLTKGVLAQTELAKIDAPRGAGE